MNFIRTMIVFVITLHLSGCMTLSTQAEDCTTLKTDGIPIVYSGSYEDIHKFILFPFTCHGEGCFAMPAYPLFLIGGLVDLPLSFVADTLLLPYTIPLSNNISCKDKRNFKDKK